MAIFVGPSLSLVLLIALDAVTGCDLNFINGSNCLGAMSWLVALAGPGMLTIIPTVIVGLIWGGVAIWARSAGKDVEVD